MKVDGKKSELRALPPHSKTPLSLVPPRSETASSRRAEARSAGLKDRVSNSGEVEESVSPRVQSIAQGLQSSVGEGLVDDLIDRVRDAGGTAVDFLESLFQGHRSRDGRLAEKREENATVAIIDYFADEGEDPEHGDIVESILQDHSGLSDSDIQRYRAGSGPGLDQLLQASPEEFGQALDAYIEGRVTGLLDASSEALEDILADENTSIRTVNQSLGVPESRIAEDIARRFEDPAFHERFLEYAGLPPDASEREVLQALVDEVSDSRRSNESVQESKERYDRLVKEAFQRGITTIDSSGNYGVFAEQLEKLGVETDAAFHTDVLNTPLVLSVGSTRTQNTETLEDDEVSGFSSPHAGADIAAQGSQVQTQIDGRDFEGSGTSYAAPQVAAAAAVLAQQYPELSAAQIRSILLRTAENPGLDPDLVGAGVLQQEEALELAQQLAA